MRGISLSGVALLVAITAAEGATIEIIRSAPDEPTIFAIEGELQYGDERKFSDKAIGAPEGIVVFNSSGGNLVAGIEIGKAIRLKGFATLVPDGTYCASACGLARLGGQRRFMGPKARVGFHAASKKEGGEARESGVANALVGAYLNSLGLSQSAVFYVTHTPPAKMAWLTFEEAAENGIEVRRFDLAGPQQPPIAPPPESVPLQQPPKTAAAIPVQPFPSDPRDSRRTAASLDLLELNTAASVQRRLMDLGFFTGLIDGVWGPRSRIALRDFKGHNGLLPNEQWDLESQELLFSAKAGPAPQTYVAPDPLQPTRGLLRRPFEPSSGTRLHPLNPIDAETVQGRLRAHGYYTDQGDGIWGLASREALHTFKVANGLSPDDRWDTAVEAALTGQGAVHARETPFGEWALTSASCFQLAQPRLVITAGSVRAGHVTCRSESGLRRSGIYWITDAACTGSRGDVPARVQVAVVDGRLVDSTVLLTRAPSAPLSYVRCDRNLSALINSTR